MNITRNTMRADGQKTAFEELEEYTERVRKAVLEALDAVDGKEWNDKTHIGGWRDQDLPALFRAIDKQAEAQFNRVNHV